MEGANGAAVMANSVDAVVVVVGDMTEVTEVEVSTLSVSQPIRSSIDSVSSPTCCSSHDCMTTTLESITTNVSLKPLLLVLAGC